MILAIFDLDNTLINGDSDHAWGEFLIQQGKVDEEHYKQKNDDFLVQYNQGKLDINEYLEFALAPLTQFPRKTLNSLRTQFMQQTVEPMLQSKAFELLQKHRDLGHFLLIITATNRFVTEPIATRLGVDDLIATEPEIIDGRYTGKVSGIPCYQDGKVTRLRAWLKNKPHNLEGSFFYSDSNNDLPLLKLADNPIAVDSDEKLTAYAQQRQWPILSLRS
ncbi:MAG: HAD-IB family hydrolase [Pseudomonadales bacterium]|nr:HAD-IB family hydrolase [Pseudomonadales bacterium]